MRTLGFALALVTVVTSPGARAEGGDCPASKTAAKPVPSAIGFQSENDLFGSGLDRHYTNGMQVFGVVGSDDVPDWTQGLLNQVPGVDPCEKRVFVLTLGQHMYTPSDKARTVPDTTDRPYAGWLYLSLSASVEDDEKDVLHDVAADVGVVGPASGAGPLQNRWHSVIGAPQVRGWGHQLKNEPGLLLTYQNRRRFDSGWRIGGLDVDASRSWGGAVGNIFTHATVGASARIGQGLDLTRGAPFIRPSVPSAGVVREAGRWGWNLFAGVEGRAVARNIFLDGNSFRSGPSVDKRPLVGDVQMGAEGILPWGRVSFTQILRSREFEGQDDPAWFGSLSLTVFF